MKPPNKEATACWNIKSRSIAFLLASSSIACLMADFYGLCPMSVFTWFIFLPALVLLGTIAIFDKQRGPGHLWRAVCIGMLGGLLAAIAYDIFRLPFVFARELGISSIIPPMDLFKVFPRFGAMALGQPIEQDQYSLTTQLVGWAYHFSNGATFGLMYLALIGNPSRRHWSWGILFALVLELGMLFTPYPSIFKIPLTPHFVVITIAAHAIFGVALGLTIRFLFRLHLRSNPLH